MEAARLRLLNDWQHDFPRVGRPFAQLGEAVGLDEQSVLAAFRAWRAQGVLSRIGPVVATRYLGASALAALAVPEGELEAVATRVSALAEVNHNYEREHHYNLWFVLAASSRERLNAVTAGIAADTGLQPIVLPMEESYHIDLGFDLCGGMASAVTSSAARAPQPASAPCALPEIERMLFGALQDGLPLCERPYDELGECAGLSGALVCALIDEWLAAGMLRRFGVVVRHHELGYTANAMCVWDVPDEQVGELGRLLGAQPGVTLCYRRLRAVPHWRYNLFCMIHGKAREEVLASRAAITARLGLDDWPHAVLFSRRRFKQCGARYLAPTEMPLV